jgi:hypothetical protein
MKTLREQLIASAICFLIGAGLAAIYLIGTGDL